jgi:hypothetical protein
MLLMAMLALAIQDSGKVDAVLADYHALTTPIVHCVKPKDDTEITVCARRKADNYRVPLVLSASPQNSAPLRTAALTDDHHTPCGEGSFMVRCGYAGVSVSTNGHGIHYVRREKAP